MTRNSLIASGVGLLFAGCTMIPSYERPAAPISQQWSTGEISPASLAAAEIPWQEFFDNPHLQELIALSLTNNRDLRVAALRVEESRAQYRIQRSDLFPTINGNASALRQRIPETISTTGSGITSTVYDVNASAAYEVDLFGRIRSLNREALERYLASDETRKSVQIALVSEVANQYLNLVQLVEGKVVAEQNLDAVQISYNLNKRSFEAGVASELDLRTADSQVQSARVSVANFDQFIALARNALVLLVGQPLPDNIGSGGTLNDMRLLPDLPAGLPSELLQRRPDILAAEHTLVAANANIGAARAAFFPRIFLTGSGGTASAKLTDLFTGPSAAWSFGPQITVPIFEGGRNRANLDVAQIRKQIEVANYERTIQVAFREVADALAVRSIIDEKITAQRQLLEAQQRRYDLTEARYRQGVDNYLAVLLAQQDLYAARQILLQFQATRLQNLVSLYRSLGGGWASQPGAIAMN